MIKRISCFCLVLALILGSFNMKAAAGNDIYVNARCAIAMDAESKAVLFDKSSHDLVPMASTTKIMTALVAIKYGNLDKIIEVSQRSANIGGSTVGYKKGEMISTRELITGLMLRSGNDAAIALSEGIASSVDEFVKLMNEYGTQLGLVDTHFQSPHGLDSEQHYTTAYDLALVTAKANENKFFKQVVSSKGFDGKEFGFTRSYQNINKILWLIPEADGVKTGYTGKAGKCLVTSVNVEGRNVVIVVLNCKERWQETKKINDYIVENYSYKKMFSVGETAAEVKLGRKSIRLVYSKDIIIPVMKDKEYRTVIIKPDTVDKNIKEGDFLGSIYIYSENRLIYSEPLKVIL